MTQYTYKQAIADPGVISAFDPTTDVLVFTTVNAGAVSVYDDGASVMFVSAIGAVTLPVTWGQLVDGVNIRFSDGSSLSQVIMLNAILGGSGADTLTTGGGDDVVATADGNDTIDGGGGADTILAGGGDDVILESAGNDLVSGGNGNDRMSGGTGNDSLNGDTGADTLSGGGDQDVLAGNLGDDQLFGDAGDDIVYGNKGNDFIDGGSGGDTLYGGQADDVITDSAGNDLIYGNIGNDPVSGGSGADTIYGGQGDDQMNGGMGGDQMNGNRGNDIIFGGGGADMFILTPGTGADLDVIMDLTAEDSLDVRRTDVYSNSLVQLGTDVRVTLSSGDMVLFKNQTVAGMEPLLSPYYASVDKSGGSFEITPIADDFGIIDISELANGGFLAVHNRFDPNSWSDDPAQDETDILGQIFGADGGQIGATFVVNTTLAGRQSLYGAETLANGNFAVIWDDSYVEPNVRFYNAPTWQIFDGAGNKIGGEQTLSNGTAEVRQIYPHITAVADGGYMVGWVEEPADLFGPPDYRSYAQRFDAASNPVGNAFQIGALPDHYQLFFDIKELPGGNMVAFWANQARLPLDGVTTQMVSDWRIQVLAPDGTPVSEQIVIGGMATHGAEVEPLPGGSFWVVKETGNADSSWSVFWAQKFDGVGNALADPFIIHQSKSMTLMDVVATPDGGCFIAWNSHQYAPNNQGESDFYARRYDAQGNPLGEPFMINDNGIADQQARDVAMMDDGRLLGVWFDTQLDQIGGQFFEMYDGVI